MAPRRRRPAPLFDMTSVKTAGVIVALFALVLAIAPDRSSLNPPEECARTQLLYIRDGQLRFQRRHGRFGTLAELAEGGFVGTAMRLGTRDHYRFEVQLEGGSWSATARPLDAAAGFPAFRIGADDPAARETP